MNFGHIASYLHAVILLKFRFSFPGSSLFRLLLRHSFILEKSDTWLKLLALSRVSSAPLYPPFPLRVCHWLGNLIRCQSKCVCMCACTDDLEWNEEIISISDHHSSWQSRCDMSKKREHKRKRPDSFDDTQRFPSKHFPMSHHFDIILGGNTPNSLLSSFLASICVVYIL